MRTQLSKSRPSLAGQRVRIQKLARETKARNRAKGLVPRIKQWLSGRGHSMIMFPDIGNAVVTVHVAVL